MFMNASEICMSVVLEIPYRICNAIQESTDYYQYKISTGDLKQF
jgi:hypothetical protein